MPLEEVSDVIKDVVRLRAMSLSLNPSFQVYDAADMWEFHVTSLPGRKRVKFSSWKNSNL